jgi:protein tyrosine/serine phosphatase
LIGRVFTRWVPGLLLAAFIVTAPFLYYRHQYTHSKRLRVVDAGKVYRSGAMTEPGFREAFERLGIRTFINLQDEAPDPEVARGYFTGATIRESELCKEMGVNYVFIGLDVIDHRLVPAQRPRAIEQFLAIMDDTANYPVLIHCRAGLHRTGCFVALYRMEYDHWSPQRALEELRGNGFGEFVSSKANDYIYEYVLSYQPGIRKRAVQPVAASLSETDH